MTTGQPRRDGVQDRLTGHAGVQPVTLQGPGLSSPTPLRAPDLSAQARISQQLAEWGGNRIAEKVNKQNEKDMLAGQVAAAQGQTLEEINMAGNKWALEGYRMVDAQTVSSSLLAAQQAEIDNVDYQLSQDEWRDKYVGRLDAALEGVDPETARLVREQMTAHIPALVSQHTTRNVEWKEQENFDALERGIDVISRDPTATEALVLFAKGGEDSPTAGLSDDRRQAATVSGVVRAFDNDNPLAYSALVKEGLLGDNLTSDEQNAIKAAQQRFETRRRTEYNEELFNGEQALMDKVENGELSPPQAVEELSLLYADHGIKMDRADAGAIFSNAEQGQNTANFTASLLIEEAALRGDYGTIAKLSARALPGLGGNLPLADGAPADWDQIRAGIFAGESGGDYDALFGFSNRAGGKFANVRLTEMTVDEALAFADPRGEYAQWTKGQVGRVATPMGAYQIVGTALRAAKKGLGLTGNEKMTPELQEKLGLYIYNTQGTGAWEGYKGKQSGGNYTAMSDADMAEWSDLVTKHKGDVTAAAVERKFGLGAVATYTLGKASKEVMDYAASVKTGLENWRAPTAADLQAAAQEKLTTTRERLAMEVYEQTEPRLNDLDEKYKRGEMDRSEWKAQREAVYSEYGRARTEADVRHEVATIKAATDYSMAQAQKAGDEQYQLGVEAAKAAMTTPQLAWEEVLNNPASTAEEITAANVRYVEERGAIFDQYGIRAIDRGDGANAENMVRRTRDAMDKQKVWREQETEIEAAIAGGFVADLPKALQERAFKKVQEQTVQLYTEAATSGAISEEAANANIAKDMNAAFAQIGVVDPKVARQMTAAVSAPLVDKDGNPNPRAVDAITQWAELKAMNPRAADTMLSGEALAKAEAVLARTGGDPSLIGEAVRDIGMETSSRSPLAEDIDTFMAKPSVQAGIDAAIDTFLASEDIGFFQAAWSDRADLSQTYDRGYTAADNLWSDENKSLVKGEISAELAKLKRQNPNIKESDLVARAAENVERRTQPIGGDIVVLPAGQDFGKMFFGSRAAEFDHDGAVNSAVMSWLRSPEAQAQYPFLGERTFAEGLPGWVQGGIDAIPFVNFDPAMSWTEAGDTDDTGVRPFRAFVTANKTVAVEVLLPNGNYSEPIVIPAGEAGKLYMKQKKGEMLKEPTGLGTVPGMGGFGGIPMP